MECFKQKVESAWFGMLRTGILWTCVFSLVVAVAGKPAQAAAAGEEKVVFLWAFGALERGGIDGKLESVVRDAVLKTGDQFKMMVELEKSCFVYLLHHSAQDDLALLFPYDLQQFDADYLIRKRYYIPKGNAWFELDEHAGKETFYLLASPGRLKDLETLLGQYLSPGAADKAELKRRILDHVRNLKKQHRELAVPAERPVTIGGTIRGYEKFQEREHPDVSAVADEIRSGGLVVRTFTIEHR